MAGIMNKVLELFTSEDYEEEEEEVLSSKGYSTDYEDEEEEELEGKKLFGNRRAKLVNMPQAQQIKMVISQPTTFEQSEEICQFLKEKKSCIVNLFYGKGNKHRITPLSREIWNQYGSYCEKYHLVQKPDDLMFYSFRNGQRNKMSGDNVSRILSDCESKIRKDRPELIHLHSHLFRRTRAMHLYQAGVPLPTISEWLGHSNIETTRFYAKVTEEMKREALHRLSESDKSVFKDDVAFKYADNEDVLKHLCGLK